ncbi:beta carbonic anhydrase 1-like, partial [Penaeus monodon]|uniref:beta carbonic anhydrase 1-like n=1 Tax=Penaeus monodon TaxID=6687 RepID=UPI0018A73B4F
MGMSRILQGIMRYRETHRAGMVKQFKVVRDDPHPKQYFSPAWTAECCQQGLRKQMLETCLLGNKNAGICTHANLCGHEEITTEPAALELVALSMAFVTLLGCGHSDCK